jgi:hypothetical protein
VDDFLFMVWHFGRMPLNYSSSFNSGNYRLVIELTKRNAAVEQKLSDFTRWSASKRLSVFNQIKNSFLFLKFAAKETGFKLSLEQDQTQLGGTWSQANLTLRVSFNIVETKVKEGTVSTSQFPRFIAAFFREIGFSTSLDTLLGQGMNVYFQNTGNVAPWLQTPDPATLIGVKPPTKPPVTTKPPVATQNPNLETPGFNQIAIGHNEAMRVGEQYVLEMSASGSLASKQLKDFQIALDQKFGTGVTRAKRFVASGNKADVLFMVIRDPDLTAVRGGKDASGKEFAPVLILTGLLIVGVIGAAWALSVQIEKVAILVIKALKAGEPIVQSIVSSVKTTGGQILSSGLGISAALLGVAALWYVFIRK